MNQYTGRELSWMAGPLVPPVPTIQTPQERQLKKDVKMLGKDVESLRTDLKATDERFQKIESDIKWLLDRVSEQRNLDCNG